MELRAWCGHDCERLSAAACGLEGVQITHLTKQSQRSCHCSGVTAAPLALQIIRLCWQYDLLTALSYILNRGLNDYMGPAAALLMPLLLASDGSSNSRRAGYRMLVYLRCCLTGQSFPPGLRSLLLFFAHICTAFADEQ